MKNEDYIAIAFTEGQLEQIMKLQEQEGLETVQDAIMDAVGSCLKD